MVISSMKPSYVITRPLGLGLGLVDFTVVDGLLRLQLHMRGRFVSQTYLQENRQRRPFLSSWPSHSALGRFSENLARVQFLSDNDV